jgi:hypothetical protein
MAWLAARRDAGVDGVPDATTVEGVLAALAKADYAEAEWLGELQVPNRAPLP